MSRPLLHKCAGIVLFLAVVAAFIMLRSASMDQSYKDHLQAKTKRISASFAAFFAKNEYSYETVRPYITETSSQYSDLALLVAFDGASPIANCPNTANFDDMEVYDQIKNDVWSGKFLSTSQTSVVESYYNNKKFYILSASAGKGLLTFVYPRKLPVSFILRFLLEILAVGCIAAACIGMAYLNIQKRLAAAAVKPKSHPKTKAADKSAPKTKAHEKAAPKQKAASRLEPFLLERFSAIAGSVGAESLTLSTINAKSGKPDWIMTSDGDRISRSKIKGESADTRVQILSELAHGSHILRDRSRKVLIPVVINERLAAVIAIMRTKKFTGKEISQIKHSLSGIADFF